MADDIEAKIAAGLWRPGSKLPSLRKLAEQFGINTDMARRGLWELRDKGLLECRARSGVFVAVGKRASVLPATAPRIAVVQDSTNEKTYGFHITRGILEAAQQAGVIVEVHAIPYYYPQEIERAREEIRQLNDQCDAVIIVGSYDHIYQELPLRMPVVGVEMDHRFGGLVSPVSLDPFEAAELAADFFRQRKIGHVRVVSHPAPVTRRRAEVFASLWRDCEIVRDTDFSRTDIGYLFTGGTQLHLSAESHLAGNCRELPGCLSAVLSMDGKSLLVPGYGPVTPVIMPDWRDGGVQSLNEALRRIRTPGCGGSRIYLHVQLENPKR
ncbi:MAG: GntR family transcriptional regulator [Victivallaceae bacterium]